MRISDWSSDVCSSDLCTVALRTVHEAPIRVGEVVALSGLGIIGSLTAHLVRKSAGKLILIDPAAERRARSAWMGADAVVDPSAVASVVDRKSTRLNSSH